MRDKKLHQQPHLVNFYGSCNAAPAMWKCLRAVATPQKKSTFQSAAGGWGSVWAALQTFWLHLTFEIPLTLRTITFDIKAHLPRNARSSGDDDNTRVATRVGFLGVIDVDGEVGRGHGHTEAHSFCELVLTVSDLTWAKVYHLHGENTSTETQTSLHRYGLFHSNEHFFEFCLILRCADYHVLHKDNPGIYRWWMLNFSLIFCLR